ncbi:hypothetical protein EA462_05725 [Natrarchaeobius halalkaliphilus]|uniref:DUF2795 domain-containing protein n=1 Tax=Natrarchaeobius halalkaliphilus TaxID=1679091 RepID=A0A3N6M7Y3_9EURY|nr:hypothetical protein [Natrarchaeobius halalkaliphilus]RQG91461.1 hypothetical protein EA462_05725 [Natrarchaeobius halalkaliphilus]
MDSEIKLNEIESAFERLEFPLTDDEVVSEFDGMTLLLADGERNLGELLEASTSDRFDSPADLEAELHNVLPREAVGEPFQSEGEG